MTRLGTKMSPHKRPAARGPRPQLWKAGPDPHRHRQYLTWLQQKNQAQYREEGWDISFEAWCDLWDRSGQWDNRGRERGCYCMTRTDWGLPWTLDNVQIITREAHAKLQGQAQSSGWRSIAQKKKRIKLGI